MLPPPKPHDHQSPKAQLRSTALVSFQGSRALTHKSIVHVFSLWHRTRCSCLSLGCEPAIFLTDLLPLGGDSGHRLLSPSRIVPCLRGLGCLGSASFPGCSEPKLHCQVCGSPLAQMYQICQQLVKRGFWHFQMCTCALSDGIMTHELLQCGKQRRGRGKQVSPR